MLAKLQFAALAPKTVAAPHLLVVLPAGKTLPKDVPGRELLRAVLARRAMKVPELTKSGVSATLPDGTLCSWVAWDGGKSPFERRTVLRKAATTLLDDGATRIDLRVCVAADQRDGAALDTLYVLLANGTPLPSAKAKADREPLAEILWHGDTPADDTVALAAALAEGNALARELTAAAPNVLDPVAYRRRLKRFARETGLSMQEYGRTELRRLGAGAFLAVAQGSGDEGAIVHLSYRPRKAAGHIALVGKGICYDTGGHNLKPARYMAGMHEDMAGSAVVVGILLAARRLGLPLHIDAWLGIARNHLSPEAYAQGDIVKAINGTTIEVVHTDAEGRMILADTLCLAARGKPDAIIDFATLTGSMITALGTRQSGVLSPDGSLAAQAVEAGHAAGERLVAFPVPGDYDGELDSKVADVKQCTLDGEADHILAASFLKRFVDDRPWLHLDLAAANCKGGLGAIATDTTGFGVAWGIEFLRRLPGSL